MSRRTFAHGRVMYTTDWIVVGNKMLIDPNLTPRENIARFVNACSLVWLNKYRLYSEDPADIEELEQDARCATMTALLIKVRTGEYRRDLSFYLNVRSCAWSVISHVVNKFKRKMELKKPVESIDAVIDDEHCTLLDITAAHQVPKLRTDGELRKDHTSINRALQDAYDDYVGDCEELGISHGSYQDWVNKNFKERTRPLPTSRDVRPPR